MIEQKKGVSIYNGTEHEALIIKNLLESFFIQVFEDASLQSVFNPWGVSIGDFNATKLKVKEKDYLRAKKIIDDYNTGIYSM